MPSVHPSASWHETCQSPSQQLSSSCSMTSQNSQPKTSNADATWPFSGSLREAYHDLLVAFLTAVSSAATALNGPEKKRRCSRASTCFWSLLTSTVFSAAICRASSELLDAWPIVQTVLRNGPESFFAAFPASIFWFEIILTAAYWCLCKASISCAVGDVVVGA